MMHEAKLRAKATKATLERFEDRPFDWTKAATCVHLMRFHASQMGHKMPIVPRFRSPLTAKRALKDAGYADMTAMMDEFFMQIPPSMMRLGDVMAVPGDAGFHAIFIRASNTKFIGWIEDVDGCSVIDTDIGFAVGAWRL